VIQSKICMLGAFGVGKTSLVSRFVHSIFSDKYLTTVGVKIEKKSMAVAGEQVDLIIWDIYGEDDFQKVRASYLRGSSGYLLVADGTRRETLATARTLHDLAQSVIGRVPFVLVLNKSDLAHQWELPETDLADLTSDGWQIVRTSAKTGLNVDATFDALAGKMVAAR
jgi:small GTP-binding protein